MRERRVQLNAIGILYESDFGIVPLSILEADLGVNSKSPWECTIEGNLEHPGKHG